MNKQELKVRLQIAKAELQDSIYNENGCFDEIVQRIFMLALGCNDMLSKDSKDIEIQLDKSVLIIFMDKQEYLDGIYLGASMTEAHFTASSFDGSELYVYDVEEIERKYIVEFIDELIKMCDND